MIDRAFVELDEHTEGVAHPAGRGGDEVPVARAGHLRTAPPTAWHGAGAPREMEQQHRNLWCDNESAQDSLRRGIRTRRSGSGC
jgi:hypothetical protein